MTGAAITLARDTAIPIGIGGTSIAIHTDDPAFRDLLTSRYSGFVSATETYDCELTIDLVDPSSTSSLDQDLQLTCKGNEWLIQRGDFRAVWNAKNRRGQVRQPPSPYAIDSVLRIIHSLMQAERGGFLLHAASAIRSGRAFLFSGVSGAGKTTISRLAPPDATLLTDEISYVIHDSVGYRACGTPFAGELARVGENVSAPIKTVFLLEKGSENRIETVSQSEAVRCLLRNTLFFANDPDLVDRVFQSACEFVNQVPVRKLIFVPDQRVWNIIG